MAEIFRALASEKRLRILACLLEGDRCVCEAANCCNLDQPTVSKNLALLKRAGLLESIREGNLVRYRVKDKELIEKILELLRNHILREMEERLLQMREEAS